MTPQAQIRIWWDPPVGAYRLTSPFNRSLVDALKAQIPASDRLYDPTTKIWTFSEKWLTPTVNLIKLTTGATATVISRQQVENASQSQSSTTGSTGSNNQVATSSRATLDTVMITFVKNLPYEAALAAYRKAAMLCHPDRGGSMEQMSQLNATWQRLEKELWKQS